MGVEWEWSAGGGGGVGMMWRWCVRKEGVAVFCHELPHELGKCVCVCKLTSELRKAYWLRVPRWETPVKWALTAWPNWIGEAGC